MPTTAASKDTKATSTTASSTPETRNASLLHDKLAATDENPESKKFVEVMTPDYYGTIEVRQKNGRTKVVQGGDVVEMPLSQARSMELVDDDDSVKSEYSPAAKEKKLRDQRAAAKAEAKATPPRTDANKGDGSTLVKNSEVEGGEDADEPDTDDDEEEAETTTSRRRRTR